MKKFLVFVIVLSASTVTWADNITGIEELVCSTNEVMLCVEDGECFNVSAADLDIPSFVILDTDRKTISTTEASGKKRTSSANFVERSGNKVFMQGVDNGRAFSFVIEEESGTMTVAVAHHGITVSVYGACTDADVE